MGQQPPDLQALQERLDRLTTELGRGRHLPEKKSERAADPGAVLKPVRVGGMGLALALLTVAIATGHLGLIAPAILLGILSGALFLRGVGDAVLASLPTGMATRDPNRPHVGMGASIAPDAIIEPGASVEMGADVGAGAVIKRGAVVRMGSSVAAGAMLEEGAVVGWGVSVGKKAVIGRDAVIGAGSSISANAEVPAGLRMAPGTSWGARSSPQTADAKSSTAPTKEQDSRMARIDAACTRIETELQQAPPQIREMLGASAQSATALRQTCKHLLEREQLLRRESSDESLKFLEQEKSELQKRIDSSSDESVRRSLSSAVAAIEEQRRQRGMLRQSADRLDAELTRLSWTLDGMGTQLVRLRSAGQEATSSPNEGVLQSMNQLGEEIDAITQALEQVARDDRQAAATAAGITPVVDVTSGSEGENSPRDRNRERE